MEAAVIPPAPVALPAAQKALAEQLKKFIRNKANRQRQAKQRQQKQELAVRTLFARVNEAQGGAGGQSAARTACESQALGEPVPDEARL